MNRYIIMAKKLADRFEKETLYLCDLDRKAGDGDHGITIARGFEEAYNHVSKRHLLLKYVKKLDMVCYALWEEPLVRFLVPFLFRHLLY